MRHLARNLFCREHVGTTKLPAQHGGFPESGLRLLAVSVVVRVGALV
jgi:hypothetical protein